MMSVTFNDWLKQNTCVCLFTDTERQQMWQMLTTGKSERYMGVHYTILSIFL